MPVPKGTRFRFRNVKGGIQRLGFKNKKVVEIKMFRRKDGTKVRGHTRR